MKNPYSTDYRSAVAWNEGALAVLEALADESVELAGIAALRPGPDGITMNGYDARAVIAAALRVLSDRFDAA